MLSLLLKLKSYLPLAAIIFAAVCLGIAAAYYYQYSQVLTQNQLLTAQLNIANNALQAQNEAVERWRAAGDELEQKLRLTEKEVAEKRRESQKRVNVILNATIPAGCENAIQWGIAVAPNLIK